MKRFITILTAIAACVLGSAAAIANTNHWRDTVTYVKGGGLNNGSCMSFQTSATGGVMGIDNSSGGDTGATGYTGNATILVVGVGSGTNSQQNTAGLTSVLLENSRITAGGFTINWIDYGANSSTLYSDCPVATGVDAGGAVGQ